VTRRNQNAELWEGEYKTLAVSVVDASSVAVNLTGATITWKLTTQQGGGTTLLTKTIGSGITVVSAAGGTLTITFAAVDTVDLGGLTYYHELEITDASSHPEIGFIGTVTINKSAVL
jgi:hypothetical protein